jgi:hypothetical protein
MLGPDDQPVSPTPPDLVADDGGESPDADSYAIDLHQNPVDAPRLTRSPMRTEGMVVIRPTPMQTRGKHGDNEGERGSSGSTGEGDDDDQIPPTPPTPPTDDDATERYERESPDESHSDDRPDTPPPGGEAKTRCT